MSDPKRPAGEEDSLSRRDLLRRISGFSAIASLALLCGAGLSGCGDGEDGWYDGGGCDSGCDSGCYTYPDASMYGDAYL